MIVKQSIATGPYANLLQPMYHLRIGAIVVVSLTSILIINSIIDSIGLAVASSNLSSLITNGPSRTPPTPTPIKIPVKKLPISNTVTVPQTVPPVPKADTYASGLTNDPGLQNLLEIYRSQTKAPLGIVVLDLTDKTYAEIEPNQVFVATSLYKLFVTKELYDLQSQNSLTLSQTVVISQQAVDQDSLDPNLAVGSVITIHDCINRMLTVSDNACGYLLGNLIGWGDSNDALHASGYTETNLGVEQSTSARDTAFLLRQVAEGRLVDQIVSTGIENMLLASPFQQYLPILLPPGAIAHKVGTLNGLAHDAGIVRSNGKVYVITVLSGPWEHIDDASSSIAQMSKQVYDYITSFTPAH